MNIAPTLPRVLLLVLVLPALALADDRREEEKKGIPLLRALSRPPADSSDHRHDTLATFRGGSYYPVAGVAFSPSQNLLALSSSSELVLLDLTRARPLWAIPGVGLTRTGQGVAFSPDGKQLVVGCADRKLRVYEVSTGEVVRTVPTEGFPYRVAWSADGSTVSAIQLDALHGYNATVSTWKTSDWKPRRAFLTFSNHYNHIAEFSPSGTYLVQGPRKAPWDKNDPGPLRVWNLLTEKATLLSTDLERFSVAFLPGEKELLVSAYRKDYVVGQPPRSEVWKVGIGKDSSERLLNREHSPARMCVSPDGKYVFLHTMTHTSLCCLIELATGKERWWGQATHDQFPVFSPTGQLLASPRYHHLDLYALEDLLHPAWADLGPVLEKGRLEMRLALSLSPQQIRLRSSSCPPAELASVAEALPGLSHLDFRYAQGWSAEMSRALEKLKGPLVLDLRQVRYIAPGAFEPLGPMKKVKQIHLNECSSLNDQTLASLAGVDSLESLSLAQCRGIKGEGLKALAGLRNLRQLDLSEIPGVTDDTLIHLKDLTNLRELKFYRGALRGPGLVHLRELRQLEVLDLTENPIEGEHLASLAGLTQLTELRLNSTRLTDPSLRHLAALTSLKRLHLVGPGRFTAEGMESLRKLTSLEELNLTGCKVPAEGLAFLSALPRMRQLTLAATLTQDETLKHLSGMKELTTLNLRSCDVQGQGLKHLAGLEKLSELDLSDTEVTDEGFAGVRELTNLVTIKLPPQITDAALAHLAGLKKIEELSLYQQRYIRGDGLHHLKELPLLKRLILTSGMIDDEGMRQVAELKELRTLSLNQSKITARSLPHLQKLPRLRQVSLPQHGSFTKERLKELREAMPFTLILEG